jgi:hypothetical protein
MRRWAGTASRSPRPLLLERDLLQRDPGLDIQLARQCDPRHRQHGSAGDCHMCRHCSADSSIAGSHFRMGPVPAPRKKRTPIWLMMPDVALPGARARDAAPASPLTGRFGGDELHGWPLDSFSDCFSVAEIVLLPFAIRSDVLRWHEAYVVAKRMRPAAEVMSTDASLHADQAAQQISQPSSDLAACRFQAQDDCITLLGQRHELNFLPISMPMVVTDRFVLRAIAVLLFCARAFGSLLWREGSTAGASD